MSHLAERDNCTGCGACVDICFKQAIHMEYDINGFLYPRINVNQCVSCGLCTKVCDYEDKLSIIHDTEFEQQYYVLKSKDVEILKESSSGGAFTAISNSVLGKKGIVYGCGFDNEFLPRHCRAESNNERDKLRGSKYVQSDMTGIYCNVKKDLQNGRIVLFTGTPCQIAALKRYLDVSHIDTSKLFTVDIICHGVPSRGVWREYIHSLEKRYHGKISSISFRTKKQDSNGQILTIKFDNGKKYVAPSGHDPYYTAFLKNYILRISCFNCQFCSLDRVSDITIADLWGKIKLEKIIQDYLRESSLIINTKKGKSLFESISIEEYDVESVDKRCIMQLNLHQPQKKPIYYNLFNSGILNDFRTVLWKISSTKDKIIFLMNRLGLSEFYSNLKK